MTPRQKESIKNKIKRIKLALAADKRYWKGYYHDGQGLRYMQPKLYIKLGDFTGGLRYLNWFNKNFPDDGAYAEFFFEWAIVLFKTKRLKEAEKKVIQVFFNNTYIFDHFFGKELVPREIWEDQLEGIGYAMKAFGYSAKQEDLNDFSEWLEKLISTEKFIALSNEFIALRKEMNKESELEKRSALRNQSDELINEW